MFGVVLVLHYLGLGSVIVAALSFGMWDLVLINGLVFLGLLWMEIVLCSKRYTVPMPIWINAPVKQPIAPSERLVVQTAASMEQINEQPFVLKENTASPCEKELMIMVAA